MYLYGSKRLVAYQFVNVYIVGNRKKLPKNNQSRKKESVCLFFFFVLPSLDAVEDTIFMCEMMLICM